MGYLDLTRSYFDYMSVIAYSYPFIFNIWTLAPIFLFGAVKILAPNKNKGRPAVKCICIFNRAGRVRPRYRVESFETKSCVIYKKPHKWFAIKKTARQEHTKFSI